NTGLTTMMNGSPTTDEWAERFLKLVKSENKAVRSAAARNLVNIYDDDKEIVEALLPWVSNADWAKESRDGERRKIIEALGDHDIPEAVPALITVLSNEPDHRLVIAKVLAKKKDARAAPALRSLITQESGEIRAGLIEAFVACAAMSPDEQMANVEAYAVMTSTEEGRMAIEHDSREEYEEDHNEGTGRVPRAKIQSRISLEVLIGQVLAYSDEPDDGLAVRVIEREKVLRKKSPEVAARLAEFISRWKGAPIYLENLRKLRSDEADIDVVLTLLAERTRIREKLPNEIQSLRSSSGFARGIGACLSERSDEFLSILGTGAAEAQIGMLGCARLLRVQLPVGEVARLLDNSHPLLALAAERYLESEDSVEARRFVLNRYPGKARILGAFTAFVPEPKYADNNSEALRAVFASVGSSSTGFGPMTKIRNFEAQLQSEVIGEKDLIAVFARLPEDASGQQVVRVYKDRTTYTWYEDTARYWSRNLTEKEYKDIHGFILSSKVDNLPTQMAPCYHGCPSSEFVMLSRDGGRRVYVSGYQAKAEIAVIDSHFDAFKSKELKLNYRLAGRIKGLEVLLADSKFPVYALWKKDSDVRVFVTDVSLAESIASDLADKERADNAVELDDLDEEEAAKQRTARYELKEKRRLETSGRDLSWRTLQNGKLGAVAGEPDGLFLLRALTAMLPHYRPDFLKSQMVTFLANGDVYANRYSRGIFRARQDGEATRIRAGNYDNPVVSGDKNWVVATKFTDSEQQMMTRVNLQTGKEFPVTEPSDESIQAIAYLPAHGRVLIHRGPVRRRDLENPNAETHELESPGLSAVGALPKVGQYSLLDAATGAVKPIKGEFRPLGDPRYRELQPSSTPGAAWAAVYDVPTKTTTIGLYIEKTFSFLPVTNLPDIHLGSSDVWVQESENKIYFVYGGHVLSAPLRQP
ncbi:MAG: HEAT repeat domain-containing protein, partial [Blastocatellia bacterium]|nr:HEAT repeat domain-containing protein [Blastocatellia bacterium]